MRRLAFAISGDYARLTGGYAYDRRLIDELRALGWTVDWVEVGDGFPRPTAEVRAAVLARLQQIEPGTPILIDCLVSAVMPDEMQTLAPHYPLIPIVHHPLAFESGWSPTERQAFLESERAALAPAPVAIATSMTTAKLLAADYGVPPDRILVALPGNDRVASARGSTDEIVSLLSVGAVVPRKGHDVLVAALSTLADLPWRLTIVGDLERSADAVARLHTDIARFNLGARVTVAGGVSDDELARLYAAADIFVLASRFEGYGMAFTEAVARGLPAVGTTGGAIPEAVPHGAGILVPPDDAAALALALRRVIADPDVRSRMAAAASDAAAKLPTWRDTAVAVASALQQLR